MGFEFISYLQITHLYNDFCFMCEDLNLFIDCSEFSFVPWKFAIRLNNYKKLLYIRWCVFYKRLNI